MGACCSSGASDTNAPQTIGPASRATELSTIHPSSESPRADPRPESQTAPRPQSSRQRPGTESRPTSARPRRQGPRAESRPSSQSGRPRRPESGAESRPSSQKGRPREGPRAESRPGSRHGKGKPSRPPSSHGPSSSKQAYPTIHEDPVDDRTILGLFSVLSTLAFHHAVNYYSSDIVGTGSVTRDDLLDNPTSREARIRQLLVRTIIDARNARDVTTKALNGLITHLEPYALDPQSQDRQEDLQRICEEGATLKRHLQLHPSDWQFGSWNAPEESMVVFPSVLQNGEEVRPVEVV